MKEFNFIGSETNRTFSECIDHVRGRADYINNPSKEDSLWMLSLFNKISIGNGNVFFCIEQIGTYHYSYASLRLVEQFDIKKFKSESYIASKLTIISRNEEKWLNSFYFYRVIFSALMSDSPELLQFLVKHQNDIAGSLEENQYTGKNLYAYSNLNTLLAISGQWEQLKERLLVFLHTDDKNKTRYYYLPEYEFYLALCHRDREGMIIAMNKMLEKKFVKKVMYGADVFFDFYLQMRALICAKIAAIHGFDLGIDSPYAPKELIEYKPLERYEDPYDFMKEFDYNQPQQVWIDKWNEKMRLAKEREEAQKKKGFFARLFGK